jgi:hypothetical protein
MTWTDEIDYKRSIQASRDNTHIQEETMQKEREAGPTE